MRRVLLALWLIVPVLGAAYHYGPGQKQLALDDASRVLAEADRLAKTGAWSEAAEKYEAALNQLPGDRVAESRRIRLERAKAQMLAKQLPTAHGDLQSLVDEMERDATADPEVLFDARAALANSQYYMTWLMRLEGQPRERWEPEIEAARQTFRMLAEQAEKRGDAAAARKNGEDVESAIRLARMDLKDLQGLPLPSQ